MMILPSRPVSIVLKSQRNENKNVSLGEQLFEQTSILAEVDDVLGVPFESISIKPDKYAALKDVHKSLMKLHSMRLGGLVGTKCGSYGYLTYGSYYSEDHVLMKSISSPTSAWLNGPSLTSTGNMITDLKAPAASLASLEVKECCAENVTRKVLLAETPTLKEVPSFVLARKPCQRKVGNKAKMAESMIRQGGIYSDKIDEGLGTIVYGSFADCLQF